ncbi:MAG: DNA mismatch repair endonuclease MutL [Anaerolineae bacterium]|jgi:DNA mismatch repair protein MutL
MPIRVLPEDVASQIAAGEVVERPASVVKELIENAIDAGASTIQVVVRAGGKKFIRVVDDGCGVPGREVELAFHRHSTSKLSTADDLERITTLGFRGEALASIAAVSQMTFATRATDEAAGTALRLEGGQTMTRREIGRPPGTTVTVENLFFNVPARRKFLRSDRTERRHIDRWVTRYAMAYPELRFALSHSDRIALRSPGNGELRDVLAAIYGLEIGENALEIVHGGRDGQADIHVSGLVGPPSFHRANRTYITIFVNGRWVNDASLTYAITQAYHRLLPNGRHPLAVVMVDLPPADVDVNVHPTKAEVRFRDGDAVFRAVQKAVRRTLLERSPVPQAGSRWGHGGEVDLVWPGSQVAAGEVGRRRERLMGLGRAERPADRQLELAGHLGVRSEDGSIPPLRVIGQLGATYIVAEGPRGLYLLDQHAAHERVLFERLLAERERAEVASQALLEPAVVEVGPEAADLLEEHLEILGQLGFAVEPFGGPALLVRAVPAIVAEEQPRQVLEDVAAALLAGDEPLTGSVEEAVARQVCKQAAVKAGKVLDRPEIEALIRALEQCESPRTCPHGRPTMIRLTVEQLAREFGRH